MTKTISIPQEYNYVAAFLTLDCNFRCTYCINRPKSFSGNPLAKRGLVKAEHWLDYLNRLQLPSDLPISLQGGEPSQHPEFFDILKGLRPDLGIDLLTNLSFDVERLAAEIPPERFRRGTPYAAIRATYHPGQSNLEELLGKIVYLQTRDYAVGLYSIQAPGHEPLIAKLAERTRALGIDYRGKEYLGHSHGQAWGTYRYPQAVFSNQRHEVTCRTTELLIAPDGLVYRCHRDLYRGENPIGTIENARAHRPSYRFRRCEKFGECNPCDVKLKTNRFQEFGHASVEIRFRSGSEQPAHAAREPATVGAE